MGATAVEVTETLVALRDGTRLATDLYLPQEHGPCPALVIRGPYSRTALRNQEDPLGHARAGWAVVAQDVRGRFESEGEFDPWHQEGPDGADVIDWVAAQPWCDGRVAMAGTSYLGMAQLRAALERPAALKAIAPVVPGGDVRRGWLFEGGALRLAFVAPYAATLASTPELGEEQQAALREIASDWPTVFRTPLGSSPMRGVVRWLDRWLDEDEPYWSPLDVVSQAPRIDVPAYLVAGWFDLFCEDTIALHRALVEQGGSERTRRSQRLVVGPWTHAGLYAHLAPDFDFGPEANGLLQGIPGEQAEWLRRAVDDEEAEGGVRAYLTGAQPGPGGRWRRWPAWPPATEPYRLYLGSDGPANTADGYGTLTPTPPPAPGRESWTHDPLDPVPSLGGRSVGPYRPYPGPADQRSVEARRDVVVFTSEPLAQAIEIAGEVLADVAVASSAPSTDVVVKLVDVWPDGRAYNVVDSVTRADLRPDEPTEVRVRVGSALHRFAAGHRVRVQIASSNFPRLDINPHSGVAAAAATAWRSASNTLHHGGPVASRVTLPVLRA